MAARLPTATDAINVPFVLLRTPAFATNVWCDALQAGSVHSVADRFLEDDRFRFALGHASPDLETAIKSAVDHNEKSALGVIRYGTRIATRATPFGVFAGITVGMMGDRTELQLAPQVRWRVAARADSALIFHLCEQLRCNADAITASCLTPNTTLYSVDHQFRYLGYRLIAPGYQRQYQLQVIEQDPVLTTMLDPKMSGLSFDDYVKAVVRHDYTEQEGRDYVLALVESQLLEPDVFPPLTSNDPLAYLISWLADRAVNVPGLEHLKSAQESLTMLSTSYPPKLAHFRSALASLGRISDRGNQLVQIDLHKEGHCTVATDVVKQVDRAVSFLAGMRAADPLYVSGHGSRSLKRFKEAFEDHFGDELVPLQIAIDDDLGVGWDGRGSDRSYQIGDPRFARVFGPSPDETLEFSGRDRELYQLATMHASDGLIELSRHSVSRTLFDSTASIEEESYCATVEIANGNRGQAVYLKNIAASPGSLMGRFCFSNARLSTLMTEISSHKDATTSGIVAEVLHVPQGRAANVIQRPRFTKYEIPILSRGEGTGDETILPSELCVAVRGGRIILWCDRLKQEIHPQNTSAHYPLYYYNLPLYRFLYTLQFQGSAIGGWRWGAIAELLPTLPRVAVDGVTVALARWRISEAECRDLKNDMLRGQGIRQWRERRRIPRYVILGSGDEGLYCDLENETSVRAFAQQVRPNALINEAFQTPETAAISGEDGKHFGEVLLPVLKAGATNATSFPYRVTIKNGKECEWLYAKVYGSYEVTNDLLLQIGPQLREMRVAGTIDEWFFIRYRDPKPHVRLRVRARCQIRQSILATLTELAATYQRRERITIQTDAYIPEIIRYGGNTAIEIAEQMFRLDSEFTVAMLRDTPASWQFGLSSILAYARSLGAGEISPTVIIDHCVRSYGVSSTSEASTRIRRLQRELRGEIEVAAADASRHPVLVQRTKCLEGLVGKYAEKIRTDVEQVPMVSIASSHIHMHVNRLFIKGQRYWEQVLYSFAERALAANRAREQQRHV